MTNEEEIDPRLHATARYAARLDELNATVSELVAAGEQEQATLVSDLSKALGSFNTSDKIQSANFKALLDIVSMLSNEVDRLRIEIMQVRRDHT